MRSLRDVHLAHDLLNDLMLLTGPCEDLEPIGVMGSVLCWVLDHEHNRFFARFLEEAREQLELALAARRANGETD
jgi:hypothetical protein